MADDDVNDTLLTQDGQDIGGLISDAPQWGIFLDGAAVVVADTVVALGYTQDWSLSNYPVEQGAFETYNKVSVPFNARLRFASGGSAANRQALLDSVAAIAGDLQLYDVVTPEAIYASCNVMHYDYKRTSIDGVGIIQVDVWLLQVRVTATSTFSNTKSPSAAGTTNDGAVQTDAPSQKAQSDVSKITPSNWAGH